MFSLKNLLENRRGTPHPDEQPASRWGRTERSGKMPVYTIAEYRVRVSGADKVKAAIEEFVPYVRDNELGTRLYEGKMVGNGSFDFLHQSSTSDSDRVS